MEDGQAHDARDAFRANVGVDPQVRARVVAGERNVYARAARAQPQAALGRGRPASPAAWHRGGAVEVPRVWGEPHAVIQEWPAEFEDVVGRRGDRLLAVPAPLRGQQRSRSGVRPVDEPVVKDVAIGVDDPRLDRVR